MTILLLLAAVSLLSPEDGATISLVPENQRPFVEAKGGYSERIAMLRDDRLNRKCEKFNNNGIWKKGKPLVLRWSIPRTDGWKFWKVEIGQKPDLSDARVWATRGECEKDDDPTNVTYRFEVPYANPEIGRTFRWRVSFFDSLEHCADVSAISSFRTEDLFPRWINIRGAAENIRDFGGNRTKDGRRVRQGMIYRGQGLNDNALVDKIVGDNRLTATDVEYFTKTLGIRTDLDLRRPEETAFMSVSPLGPAVNFVQHSSPQYVDAFRYPGWKKVMAENFRVFLDRANYPIYFHCIAGADRTGTLAYVLNGALGVDRDRAELDWELTMYPHSLSEARGTEEKFRDHRIRGLDEGVMLYGDGDSTWNERIELYLKSCGITQEEIESFRKIMLEEGK